MVQILLKRLSKMHPHIIAVMSTIHILDMLATMNILDTLDGMVTAMLDRLSTWPFLSKVEIVALMVQQFK